MLTAARLGGELVYRHGIGTDHAPNNSGAERFTAVLDEAGLHDDRPHPADLNGIPIVLVKTGGRVFALRHVRIWEDHCPKVNLRTASSTAHGMDHSFR